MVVAVVRYISCTISGRNHKAATFAGQLSRKGCPTAHRHWPASIQAKLATLPQRTQHPAAVNTAPINTCLFPYSQLQPTPIQQVIAGKVDRDIESHEAK